MISVAFQDRTFVLRTGSQYETDVVKSVPGRLWSAAEKTWRLPATSGCAAGLYRAAKSGGVSLSGDARFAELVEMAMRREKFIADPEAFGAAPIEGWEGMAPRSNQRFAARWIAVSDGVYLAHEMGTGKTFSVVLAAIMLEARAVFVACPKRVAPSWVAHWKLHDPKRHIVHAYDGPVRDRVRAIEWAMSRNKPFVVIANYEATIQPGFSDVTIGQAWTEFKTEGGRKEHRYVPVGEPPLWDIAVSDEAHRIKDPKGRQSGFMHALSGLATRRVALSGTPIQSTPMDLFAPMRFVDPGALGLSYSAFQMKYATFADDGHVVGFERLPALRETVAPFMHRVRKDQVLDLPRETISDRVVELGEKARKLYEEMKGGFVATMGEKTMTLPNVLVELLRLQQVTGGAARFDGDTEPLVIDKSKQEAVEEILNEVAPDRPVVVFARFRFDLARIREAAKNAGRAYFEVSGGCKADSLASWQADKGGSVLGVQIDAGGEGIDCSRADTAIFYSTGFSFGRYDQARARVHRHGQTRPVNHIHLVAKDTIDEIVYRILARRGRDAATVIEGEDHLARLISNEMKTGGMLA